MTNRQHEVGGRYDVATTRRARLKPRTVRVGTIQVLGAYDIEQSRVRSKIARILESEGVRMQGFVFVLEGIETRIAGILRRVVEVEGLRDAVCGGSVLHCVVAYRIQVGTEILGVGDFVPRKSSGSEMSFGPHADGDTVRMIHREMSAQLPVLRDCGVRQDGRWTNHSVERALSDVRERMSKVDGMWNTDDLWGLECGASITYFGRIGDILGLPRWLGQFQRLCLYVQNLLMDFGYYILAIVATCVVILAGQNQHMVFMRTLFHALKSICNLLKFL